MIDILKKLQDTVIDRVKSVEYFSDIPVLEEKKGITEDTVNNALKAYNSNADERCGVCICAYLPSIHDGSDMSPFVQREVQVAFGIFEKPEMNLDPEMGIGKDAESIAVMLVRTLHQFYAANIGNAVLSLKSIDSASAGSTVGYNVTFGIQLPLGGMARCGNPLLREENGKVTCKVAPLKIDGIEVFPNVWYCEEFQGYPSPKNPNAKIFTNAENLAAGFYLFCAYAAGALPSDVAGFQRN